MSTMAITVDDWLNVAGVVLVSLAFLALYLAIRWYPTIRLQAREWEYRREATRFRREPRVGDRCGYSLNDTTRLVGVVSGDEAFGVVGDVEIFIERNTATGPFNSYTSRNITELRWYPPTTPLGPTSHPGY